MVLEDNHFQKNATICLWPVFNQPANDISAIMDEILMMAIIMIVITLICFELMAKIVLN